MLSYKYNGIMVTHSHTHSLYSALFFKLGEVWNVYFTVQKVLKHKYTAQSAIIDTAEGV